MIRYNRNHPPTAEQMGFLGPLIGLGTTVVGALLASDAAEDAQKRAAAQRKAEWEAGVAASSAAYASEMELWRLRKEAAREEAALAAVGAEERALKSAQTMRIAAIGGAILLGTIGVGLLLR